MAIEVVMPKFGLTMQEGFIAKWNKQEGERVEADEPLLEVETEKITTEIPSPATGIVSRICFQEGTNVPCGETIALIDPS